MHTKYLVVLCPLVILSDLCFPNTLRNTTAFPILFRTCACHLPEFFENSGSVTVFLNFSYSAIKSSQTDKPVIPYAGRCAFPIEGEERERKPSHPLVHNAAEGVFLNLRQWTLMDHLCCVLKSFQSQQEKSSLMMLYSAKFSNQPNYKH